LGIGSASGTKIVLPPLIITGMLNDFEFIFFFREFIVVPQLPGDIVSFEKGHEFYLVWVLPERHTGAMEKNNSHTIENVSGNTSETTNVSRETSAVKWVSINTFYVACHLGALSSCRM
jgi:hypothetical protein